MQKSIYIFLAVAGLGFLGVLIAEYVSDTPTMETLQIEHVATYEMDVGTHRPEILIDGETIYLGVVDHFGEIRHQLHVFDLDFEEQWTSVLSEGDDVYGRGADHRMTIVGDELVMVYQTLVRDENAVLAEGELATGEATAAEQSLILARFNPDDGEEIFWGPIVAHVTDFSEDSFPDHSLVWDEQREELLVNTGTMGPGNEVTIRSVDIETAASSVVYRERIASDEVTSKIGNGMLINENGDLLVFGSDGFPEGDLSIAVLDDTFTTVETSRFEEESTMETFPTGVIEYRGHYFIGYSQCILEGDGFAWENCRPHLKMIDAATFEEVWDIEVDSDKGFGALHPTLAMRGNTLYYAWSSDAGTYSDGVTSPQVRIEIFEID